MTDYQKELIRKMYEDENLTFEEIAEALHMKLSEVEDAYRNA